MERDHLEDPGLDGIMVKDVGWEGMDCIDQAQEWDRWRALVNAVINLRLP
jgi:hypothetical protein